MRYLSTPEAPPWSTPKNAPSTAAPAAGAVVLHTAVQARSACTKKAPPLGGGVGWGQASQKFPTPFQNND